jgi:hypothetical protein
MWKSSPAPHILLTKIEDEVRLKVDQSLEDQGCWTYESAQETINFKLEQLAKAIVQLLYERSE